MGVKNARLEPGFTANMYVKYNLRKSRKEKESSKLDFFITKYTAM
jgi:hypothetical protein